MKRNLFFGLLAAGVLLAGCDEKPVRIAALYVEKEVTIGIGHKYRLTAQFSPPEADDPRLLWMVEDPDIVSVDPATGELIGLKEGTTRVAATARDLSATCEVTVEFDIFMHMPDPVLREYCEQNYDKNHNGILTPDETTDASVIRLEHLEISSFEGLEYFQDQFYLILTDCKIASLDRPELPRLTLLILDECEISTLDLSKFPNLTNLSIYNSDMPLTELDVSALTSLTWLSCPGNGLASLDVSMLPALEIFGCGNNLLRSIDISNNPRLQLFHCEGNPGADGVFAVRSWFDNEGIPTGPVDPDDPDSVDVYQFSESWEYQGRTVRANYQKVI